MTPGVDLAHELAEARRRLDELESLVENSSVAIVLMGYGVLAELKDDSHLRDIPMVMTSSLDEIDSVVKCIEMGAEDYLTKPINPVLLNARVTVSLEKKRLRDQQRVEAQGELLMKGKTRPVQVYAVQVDSLVAEGA